MAGSFGAVLVISLTHDTRYSESPQFIICYIVSRLQKKSGSDLLIPCTNSTSRFHTWQVHGFITRSIDF